MFRNNSRTRFAVFVTLLSFSCLVAQAQQAKIKLMGAMPNVYVVHTVSPGETLSAIGKMYNQTVGNIMRFNSMNAQSQLSIGEAINVPLAASSFLQTAPTSGTALVHTVKPGESLYRISVTYNKVPVAALQQWNALTGNNISVGQDVIVGYLNTVVKNATATTTVPSTPTTKPADAPVEPVVKPTAPVVVPPVTTTTKPVEEPVKTTVPVADKKPESKPSVVPPPVNVVDIPAETKPYSGAGFFANQFGKDVAGRDATNVTGSCGSFKSVSGWNDGKFYALMNETPPGSIVKISYNGKFVFAKVLWNMKDMKENDGLQFRVSNAAAAALGFTAEKNTVTIQYFD